MPNTAHDGLMALRWCSAMPPASHLETAFALWLRQHPSIPEPETEYRFHPQRKWRLDMAWPDQMVAVEIEGITYAGGRHQRVAGFLADAEKYEAAMLAGWTVFRVPGQWVAEGSRMIWREQVIDTLKQLLGVN